MRRRIAALLAAGSLIVAAPAWACDATLPCDKCAKDSEASWNPDNKLVSARLERFYSLDSLAKAAYEGGDFDGATRLAKEYLELATLYRCDWNYGNAIHDANSYLGLISLKKGDGEAAATYLVAAGKSTGSPQLDSFGPDLDLANALLKEGRVLPVKQYLNDIRGFWKMGDEQTSEWLAGIEKGEKPELNRFPPRVRGIETLVLSLYLAWPLLVMGGFLYFIRRRVSRKWLFAVTSLVSGYVAMLIAGWGAGLLLPMIIGSMETPSFALVMAALIVTTGAGIAAPPLAVLGVSRFFVAPKEPAEGAP
jgi:hypothetical protein